MRSGLMMSHDCQVWKYLRQRSSNIIIYLHDQDVLQDFRQTWTGTSSMLDEGKSLSISQVSLVIYSSLALASEHHLKNNPAI